MVRRGQTGFLSQLNARVGVYCVLLSVEGFEGILRLGQFGVYIRAFVGDQMAARFDKGQGEFRQDLEVADGPGRDDVVLISMAWGVGQCFCPDRKDADIGQAEQINDLLLKRGFLARGFNTGDLPLCPGNGQGQPGKARSGSEIKEPGRTLHGHESKAFQGVGKMTRVNIRFVCDSSEIVLLVFTPEKFRELGKTFQLLICESVI